MNEESVKRICVIGGGSSGLAAIKSCKEEGLDVVCYEKSESFGGLWRFSPSDEDGRPSVMKSTVINTSKEMSAFSDFPPPENFANFMHNTFMLKYFRMYAEHFDLVKHIKTGSEVTLVEKSEDYESTGKWKIFVKNLKDGSVKTETFHGVLVCAGHHIFPHIPQFEGLENFEGTVLHTHSLKSGLKFEDKTVLVMGIGNSAVDAAVEISNVSKQLYLSTRRGSWIFSRLGYRGAPYDTSLQLRIYEIFRQLDYFNLSNAVLEFFLNFKFDHKKFGLQPKHRVLNAHFTINDALPNCIVSGKVTVKQNVCRFTKNGVIFEGEDEVTPIDAVVMATGYKIKFPFISDHILQVSDNNVNLYKFVFPPHLPHPTLAFIALVQPLGAMFPIAEAQSRWFVQLIQKNVALPSSSEMEAEIEKRRKENCSQYVPSLRHTVQVLWIPYMDEICAEFSAKPNIWKLAISDPRLFYTVMFGPCTPYQYRLQGPHPWSGAREAILTASNRIAAPLRTSKRD